MVAKKPSKSGIISGLLSFIGISAVAAVLLSAAVAPAIAVTGLTTNSALGVFDELPTYLKINELAEKTTIYAKAGDGTDVPIASFYAQNRETVDLDQISPYAIDAAIATEDPRFFEHGGVDLIGTTRALLSNALGGEVQGGSSITQQYVKNILVMRAEDLPDPESRKLAYAEATKTTPERKLKEMRLAVAIESKYTKEEILNGYLNVVSFGGQVYGIEAAAKRYFGVSAKDLTLAQSASLIASIQNPNYLRIDIPENIEANQQRRDYVLSRMKIEGKITEKEYQAAVAEPVTPVITEAPSGCQTAGGAAYFCDYITRIIKNDKAFGETEDERFAAFQRGGWQIYTTLNLDLQAATNAAIDERVAKNVDVGDIAAASVSVEVGTGRVLAMGQSKDYSADPEVVATGPNYTSVNYNTDFPYGGSTGFPVGSTYKIFTLAEWLKQGNGLQDMVNGRDRVWTGSEFTNSCEGVGNLNNWRLQNFNGPGTGRVWSAEQSLINSWNTNFMMMASKLDLCEIRKTAESFMVHRADNRTLTSNPMAVLGSNEIAPLTMAVAVAGFANNGKVCSAIAIDAIKDRNGKDIEPPKSTCKQAVSPAVANTVASAMAKVIQGSARWASPNDGVPFVSKTGTSDNSEHNWMLGTTTRVATATWIGNVTGHTNVGQYLFPPYIYVQNIWRDVMAVANSIYGGGAFPAPDPTMNKGKSVTVPAINGLTLEQAKELIESVGLLFKDGGEIDSEIAKGLVVKSDPEAGGPTSVGGEITVYTSNQSLVTGPASYVGSNYQTAVTNLRAAGWNPVVQFGPGPVIPCPVPTPAPTPAPQPTTCYDTNSPDRYKVESQDVVGGFHKPGTTVTLKVVGPQ